MEIEKLSSQLYEHVLNCEFLAAGECLNHYRIKFGHRSPYLDIETLMAIRYTLQSLGMDFLVLRINREIISHEKSGFWQVLAQFWWYKKLKSRNKPQKQKILTFANKFGQFKLYKQIYFLLDTHL